MSWTAVVGFGVLGLLWPLLRLLGLESAVGGTGTALAALAVVLAAWSLGAGFGHVPRPVLTLSLAGVVSGLLLGATGLVLGERPDVGPGLHLAATGVKALWSAGFGTLAGLLATAIQRILRPYAGARVDTGPA